MESTLIIIITIIAFGITMLWRTLPKTEKRIIPTIQENEYLKHITTHQDPFNRRERRKCQRELLKIIRKLESIKRMITKGINIYYHRVNSTYWRCDYWGFVMEVEV
jgi:ABC-type nickel/cobalt efflux system permease component RcnA